MEKTKITQAFKICLVSPSRWRYTRRLAEELCSLNNNVFLLVDKRPKSDVKKVSTKFFVKEVWNQSDFLPRYVFTLFCEILRIKPKIVHIQFEYLIFGRPITGLFFPVLLSLLRLFEKAYRFRIVLTLHSIIPLDKVRWIKKILFLSYTKLVIGLSNKIIVHTRLAKEILVKGYSVSEEKIVVIPMGIETKFPRGTQKRIKELKLGDKKIILHFGILRSSKGLNKLLLAFKKVLAEYENVMLVISGWFHEYLTESEIMKFFSFMEDASLKDHLKVLIEYLPEEKLYDLISESDVICLPYRENYVVGVSAVVADIVMLGKPIVVTKCLKFSEFKRFSNVVFTDDNIEDLSKALIKVLKNPPLASLGHINGYSWEAVAKKTLSCYCSVM